jgi:WD40 repeat protein
MITSFDAYVTAALFDAAGQAAFALGDGTVRFPAIDGVVTVEAHDGAVLSACVHPSGRGVVTGGDDGAVVWSRIEGGEVAASRIAEVKGRWIESLAASTASGLIAFGAGRELHVRDVKDAAFARTFAHEKSVADLAFDPKGKRLAAATYGGAALWWARIAEQKPQMLKWAGSHVHAAWSPDGKYVVTAMQDNQLHGWRLSDGKDMRMGGYPAKTRSLVFFDNGRVLGTSGANGAVIWPFAGADGPMGKEAAEIGFSRDQVVSRVAAAPKAAQLCAAMNDGRIWTAHLRSGRIETLKADKGAQITALAVSVDGARMAWGDEDGEAGIVALSDLG